MIPAGVQIFVALEPVDGRWGYNRLAGAALEKVGYDARSGALFVFFGKTRRTLRILFFDGTGMCLFSKRLDAGTFRVPRSLEPGATTMSMGDAELDALLDGVEVDGTAQRPSVRRRIH